MFFQTTGVPPGYGFYRADGRGYVNPAVMAAASNPGGLAGRSMDWMAPSFKPMTRLQAHEYFLPEM
jgi:hypothetical protein